MFLDRYYTPAPMATALVANCSGKPERIADFCVGDGSLIKAAITSWPRSNFFICDIDPDALRAAVDCTGVTTSLCCDFLGEKFSEATTHIEPLLFDLILMNPPFSNRGGRRCVPRGSFSGLSCSRAFSFLLTAVDYLSAKGEILAILPSSVLSSEQDEVARTELKRICSLELLSIPQYGAFPAVDASTFMLRLRKFGNTNAPRQTSPANIAPAWRSVPAIKRGTISVPRANRAPSISGVGWVHTTSIINGRIQTRYEFPHGKLDQHYVLAKKYSLLIPRVGRIRPGNLAAHVAERDEVISDCLFAVACENLASVNSLFGAIIEDFVEFRKLYVGTGAPYLTVGRLAQYLLDRQGAHIVDAETAKVKTGGAADTGFGNSFFCLPR